MTKNKNIILKTYPALFIGLSFMCFSAILVKSSNAPGIVTAFYRMGIGAVVLIIPFLIFFVRSKQKMPIRGVILAIFGGICFGADMALWATGVIASNATIPTVFANTVGSNQ